MACILQNRYMLQACSLLWQTDAVVRGPQQVLLIVNINHRVVILFLQPWLTAKIVTISFLVGDDKLCVCACVHPCACLCDVCISVHVVLLLILEQLVMEDPKCNNTHTHCAFVPKSLMPHSMLWGKVENSWDAAKWLSCWWIVAWNKESVGGTYPSS